VKDLDSQYVVNERRAGWWKLKPEYSSTGADDLDLIVLGVFFSLCCWLHGSL
jgi:ATP-dependent DNA ligase